MEFRTYLLNKTTMKEYYLNASDNTRNLLYILLIADLIIFRTIYRTKVRVGLLAERNHPQSPIERFKPLFT